MIKFKRIFSRFLHRKPRKHVCEPASVTPTSNDSGESCSLRRRAHPVPESTNQNVIQPLADVVEEEVDESGSRDNVHNTVTHPEVEVPNQVIQSSTNVIVTSVEGVGVEQGNGNLHTELDHDDFPEYFSSDQARSMHLGMIIHQLYVALTNDDKQIAALRTLRPNRFTHIVHVAFGTPFDGNNIRPSNWKVEFSDVSPHEVRLTCPALAFSYGGRLAALTGKQIRVACNFIACARDPRKGQPRTCKNARVLVVAPPDRSIDIMAIVVFYMSYWLEFGPEEIWDGLQRGFQIG